MKSRDGKEQFGQQSSQVEKYMQNGQLLQLKGDLQEQLSFVTSLQFEQDLQQVNSRRCDEACVSLLGLAGRRSVVGRRFEACCVQGLLLHLLQNVIGGCVCVLVSNFRKSR